MTAAGASGAPTVDVAAANAVDPESCASPAAPPVQLAIHRSDGITFCHGPFGTAESEAAYAAERAEFTIDGPTSKLVYLADGSLFAVGTTAGVRIVDAATLTDVAVIDNTSATTVAFSPKGTFVTTHETLTSQLPLNYVVWRVSTGEPVLRLALDKDPTKHRVLQWTQDEAKLLLQQGGEILVYDGQAPEKPLSRLAVQRLASYSLSPLGKDGKTTYVAAFTQARAGSAPAAVLVFDLAAPAKAKAMLPFGAADEATLSWNSLGSAVLIRTLTHDSGGTSYYGNTRLYLLLADGSAEYNISLSGTILDVAWAPRTYEFITLSGEARCAKATVWSAKTCQPVKELGIGAWNTIRFSPSGRFVTLAGFGALAGEFEVWDKNKLIRLCSSQDHDSPKTIEWTPCGRYFVTATLFPWLRVGNLLKIRHYTGAVVYTERVQSEDLLQVAIRPAAHGVYADRPASPAAIAAATAAGGVPVTAAAAAAGAGAVGKSGAQSKTVPPPPAKAGGYIPPHKRAAAAAAAGKK